LIGPEVAEVRADMRLRLALAQRTGNVRLELRSGRLRSKLSTRSPVYQTNFTAGCRGPARKIAKFNGVYRDLYDTKANSTVFC